MIYTVHNLDIYDWAKVYTGERFHALFCDPPYHFTSIEKRFGKAGSAPAQFGKDGSFNRLSRGFMGKEWDGGDVSFRPETWQVLSEHLHPGALGMAFSSAREYPRLSSALLGQVGVPLDTINLMADSLKKARQDNDWSLVEQVETWLRSYNRMQEAIQCSGLILHPTIFAWVYGSGWPKATRIDNKVDERAGVEQERVPGKWYGRGKGIDGQTFFHPGGDMERFESIPVTESAQDWAGHRYGMQALKPAVEPILVFQKPFEKKPLDSMLETGAGAFNIDLARLPIDPNVDDPRLGGKGAWDSSKAGKHIYGMSMEDPEVSSSEDGRWPANFIVDESGAEALDAQTGILESGLMQGSIQNADHHQTYGANSRIGKPTMDTYGDSGGASRFFFNIQADQLDEADPVRYSAKASRSERDGGLRKYGNNHPTVKPISLTEYLCKLLLPPSSYAPRRMLVPFSGSGSEMIGAIYAGFEDVVGIEADSSYSKLAERRIRHWINRRPPQLF